MAKRNVKLETPGQEPSAPIDPVNPPASGKDRPPGARAGKNDKTVLPSDQDAPAGQLPDQSQIDASAIPYGQTRMSRQGVVCSTQEPPRKPRGG